ncbi:MAG TPA: dihydrodipicolinate synthase family protein [Vicinamibacterales bacterium]|nr:dihydrodipicolinate synthase family protein [Vicinamibacterales bacterium]
MSETNPLSYCEPIAGLFAAVVTPIQEDGRLDLRTFDRLVEFLVEAGVTGICIAGATGEYPHFETHDRKAIIRRAAERLPPTRDLLVGIGAPSMHHVVELGRAAVDAGCRALLLPMPMFFRYEQQDLAAFSAGIIDTLRAPCLLYNLPGFTNGLETETILSLLRTEEFIVGVKDSSGQTANLDTIAQARSGEAWSLLVGDDRVLNAGLGAGWDGGISGVAGFCPELLVALYRSHIESRPDDAARLQRLLDELIVHIAPFPTPWGIRIGLAARGIPTGPLPLPLTANRRRQIVEFTEWLPEWLLRNELVSLSGGGAGFKRL